MHRSENDPLVTFVLARYPRHRSLSVLAHLALDRWLLRKKPELRFYRLLGVGQGNVFNPHADLQRSALFTVWNSATAWYDFEANSPLMSSMRARAEEIWTVQMQPIRWHGNWGGRDPFETLNPGVSTDTGPWIILTRATIYPTKLLRFLSSVPAVAEHLIQQPEYIKAVGVGEAPLLYQATLSLWHSLPAVKTFAYGQSVHSEVIRRTRSERWYREELFARLRPLASYGTWDGVNPLQAYPHLCLEGPQL